MELTIEELIADLTERVEYLELNKEDMNEASWSYEQGIIMTGNEVKLIISYINTLNKGE